MFILLLAGCVEKTDWGVMQRQHSIPAGDLFAAHTVGQSFVSTHDGLSGLEVILVDYGPESDRSAVPLELLLCADPDCQQQVAHTMVPAEAIWHNQSFTFHFPPQPHSAGQSYLLLAKAPQADTPARVTLWAHTADLYPDGHWLYDGEPAGGDLTFWAKYQVEGGVVAGKLFGRIYSGLGWLPAILILLLAPGYLLSRLLPRTRDDDVLVLLANCLALSVAGVPVLLLLLSLLPLRLNGLALTLGGALLGVLALGLFVWDLRRGHWRGLGRGMSAIIVAMAGITVVGLFLRFLHSFDLVGPLWVDAVHHTLLARIIVERGGIPGDYRPYVDVAPATYHFGFQSLVAVLHWLTGRPLPDALLYLGQLLSGLAGLPLYALGQRWGRSRWAGLGAAAVPTAFSLLPAYYVSWSRYTQLVGLIILPIAAVLLDRLIQARRWHWGIAAVTAVSWAGLLVSHLRVAAFFAALGGLVLIYATMRRLYRWRLPLQPLGRVLPVALAAALLTWSWLWPSFRKLWLPAAQQWPAQTDTLSLYYVHFGPGRYVVPLALLGVALGLLRRRREALLLLVWVALMVLMANPLLLGLEPGGALDQLLPWFSGWHIGAAVDNLAVAIALYVPLSLGVALACAEVARLARRMDRRAHPWLRWAGVLLLLNLGAWGAYDLREIVNPRTALLTEADLEALAWIEENTAPEALFLINSWPWMGPVYAGNDGGYWIAPLTGRRTWPPPALYGLGTGSYMLEINTVAEEAAGAEGEVLHELLQRYGFTHVYLGPYGGPFTPEKFADRPSFRPVYANGGVTIFSVER